ncbi:unnamed protein product, partial [Pipistrellus nathusii]
MVDVKFLSDCDLQNELNKLGFSPGPILSSTRKLYENKLKQLLVSLPCVSLTMNGPGKQHRTQDYEDRQELRGIIVFKGNIILSSGKKKGCTKKRPKAFTTKPKPQHLYCQHHKLAEKTRWASGALYTRFGGWSDPEEDTCIVNEGAGSRNLERFPVGLKLAVFGIFIIVIFVYITVEKKPLLWL